MTQTIGDIQDGEWWGGDDPLRDLRRVTDRVIAAYESGQLRDPSGQDLVRLRRQFDRLDAVIAGVSVDAVRDGAGIVDGYADTAGWIAWQSGQPKPQVRRSLRRAEVLELVPATAAAWRAGQITSRAAELIADAHVSGFDDELQAVEAEFLDRARRRDHRTLATLTRHFRECARADGSKPAPPDGVTLSQVGDRYCLRGDFSVTAGQVIRDTLTRFSPRPSVNDGTTLADRQAEGLLRICDVAAGRGPDAESGTGPVIGYLTHAPAPRDPSRPLTLTAWGDVVGPHERARLLCDATLTRIRTDPDGRPLSVGRATSVWPAAIRRAIVARDQHCQWPGCDQPSPWCDAHHFQHWEHGGTTASTNGLLLCRRHHTFVHQHPTWTYGFVDEHFRAHRPDGTELDPDPWANHPPSDTTTTRIEPDRTLQTT